MRHALIDYLCSAGMWTVLFFASYAATADMFDGETDAVLVCGVVAFAVCAVYYHCRRKAARKTGLPANPDSRDGVGLYLLEGGSFFLALPVVLPAVGDYAPGLAARFTVRATLICAVLGPAVLLIGRKRLESGKPLLPHREKKSEPRVSSATAALDPDISKPITPASPAAAQPVEPVISAPAPAPVDPMTAIDAMEGRDFEHWCAAALLRDGFTSAEVTQASGDFGVDILAVKDGIRYAIQCKRYSSKLDNTPIQEVHAGRGYYRCEVAAVITNQYFTQAARELAAQVNVHLWDRDWVSHHLTGQPYRAYRTGAPSDEPAGDELLPAAVDVILETGQATASMLQRRLKLGYARAARIIDEMEEKGIVGPFRGSTPREILVTKESWAAMRGE